MKSHDTNTKHTAIGEGGRESGALVSHRSCRSDYDALVRIAGAGVERQRIARTLALAARSPVTGAVALARVAGHLADLNAVAAILAGRPAADVTGAALNA